MSGVSAERDDGGPAFPFAGSDGHVLNDSGMSLRDYFASHALNGLLSCPNDEPCVSTDRAGIEREQREFAAKMARFAYQYADAMIAERKK